jgi:hypothetical protein
MEAPGDAGQRVISLSTGALAALGIGEPGVVDDFAVEATLNTGEVETSEDIAPIPERGYGVTLGWSALRHVRHGGETDLETGPIYLEAQRFFETDAVGYVGIGAGWAMRPDTFDQGPQINVWILGPFFLRVRYLFDGGVEVHPGIQLKWPRVVTSVRSR